MNDFNTAQYVVAQAKEGKNLAKRRLLLLMYFGVSAVVIGVLFSLKLYVVVSVLPLLLWIIVHFTWRKVNVEYKYDIAHGQITFAECYSSGADNVTVDIAISKMDVICKYEGNGAKLEEYAPKKLYDYRGSVEKTPVGLALFEYEGEKTAVMFIYDKRVASLLKLYNKNTEL